MERSSRLPIFLLIGVLIILLMIPISALIINPMESDPLNTPIFELGDLSLNEMFGTDHVDEVFSNLNGHTLKDVFEDSSVYGVGKNLFDKNSIIAGYFLDASGVPYSISTGSYSEKIYVIAGETYIRTETTRTVYYDIDDNFISAVSSSTLTIPLNCSYLRINVLNTSLDTTQLETGTVATTYEPYKSTLNDDTSPFINWFNLDTLGIDTLTVEEMDMLYDYYIDWYDFNVDLYMFLYEGLSLTADQWQYYYNLYTYYSTL